MFASSALNNVFVTFYLEVFARLPPAAFVAGQVLFAAWNATNDPLFGWLSDRSGLRRSRAIRFGGRVWCLAFLLVWWPPPPPAAWPEWLRAVPLLPAAHELLSFLHFVAALFLYDGALTFVELNHSALLSDGALGRGPGERATANAWASVASGLGSASSLFAYAAWSGVRDLARFRVFAMLLAALCLLVFEASAHVLDGVPAPRSSASAPSSSAKNAVSSSVGVSARAQLSVPPTLPTTPAPHTLTFRAFLGQVGAQRNFLVFSAMSALQVTDCTFEKNFFAPFMDTLVPTISAVALVASVPAIAGTGAGTAAAASTVPPSSPPYLSLQELPQLRGAVIALSFLLPHVATVLATPAVHSRGLYATVRGVFVFRLLVLALALAAAVSRGLGPHAVLLFMLANRVSSETVCRLMPLVVADVVDEDAYLHVRPASVSASVVGTSAFAGKLGQSLAPLLGYALLPPPATEHGADAVSQAEARRIAVVWALLIGVPGFTVLAQLLLWHSSFSLHGSYLRLVKERAHAAERASMHDDDDDDEEAVPAGDSADGAVAVGRRSRFEAPHSVSAL